MPWFFNKNSLNNTSDRSFMFTHMIYDYKEGWVGNNAINNIVGPMVWSIKEHLNFKSIFRIKAKSIHLRGGSPKICPKWPQDGPSERHAEKQPKTLAHRVG